MRRVIVSRLIMGVGFLAIAVYAFSRGTGFWNFVYGIGCAVIAVGALAIAIFLIVAKRKGMAPSD